MLRTGFTTAVLALVIASGGVLHAQGTQAPPTVSYDTFMQLDHEARLRVFSRITHDNRMDLVRAQLTRWMLVNASYLSLEQWSVLEALLSTITPHPYALDVPHDALDEMNRLVARAGRVLSKAQIRQALTIDADYIPPQP